MRRRIRVEGTVQGVGFRPFVYRLAVDLGLSGFVGNDSAGVLIEAQGDEAAIGELVRRVSLEPPPLAVVRSVDVVMMDADDESSGFAIAATASGGRPTAPVSVDTATCAACLAEVDDPSNRRHRYPFTNCTNCGPRYTIVTAVPYDRSATTMAGFEMCEQCNAEYHDPADRRFHAQPNACPACGPALVWLGAGGEERCRGDAALAAAGDVLRAGGIAAVKGVGGYHLAVDAASEAAVSTLRRRKGRDEKPFAVMVATTDQADELCELGAGGRAALESAARPIVLAPRRSGARVASSVAPGAPELGVLLAYTPLHHLLLGAVGRPLVMTSGNLTDEPIAHIDNDARTRLGPLVDGLLAHDRPIHIRCDDSVVRAKPDGDVQVLRRSRGLAPRPMALPVPARRPLLAVGAELKSTVTVATGSTFVTSHHLGDLAHVPTYLAFLQAVEHLCGLYEITPDLVAHDLHPEYLSTKFAMELDCELVGVQHHHAHIASCLAEHCRVDPVIGLAFDGLGYGPDGTLWGGELLLADLGGFERLGHLAPIAMPGGSAAVREPWRMGVAWAGRAEVAPGFDDDRLGSVQALVDARSGPVTTSAGRLFDAVAALLGLAPVATYEAQAAIQLEAMAWGVDAGQAPAYPITIGRDSDGVVIDPAPLVAAVVGDARGGRSISEVAAGFHDSFGGAAAAAAIDLARAHGVRSVALSGGVFQNSRLAGQVADLVAAAGLEVLVHRLIPPNDGGISVGQAAIAAAR